MATTFYFQSLSQGGTPISPTVSGTWNQSGGSFFRANCYPKKGLNSSITTVANTSSTHAVNWNAACMQFISPPLAAQTITGTFSSAMYGKTSVGTSDFSAFVCRVIAPDGTTVRGTLVNGPAVVAGTNFTTTGQTGCVNGATVTSVTATAGDYLVIEIGWNNTNSTITTVTLSYGDAGASDYIYSATNTTAGLNPSCQFSATINFLNSANQLMMVGCGT